jgi:TfoX/Sxy family transcriptional regulator of competence genes
MPYDERLAARIRSILAARKDVAEKKMFGGIAFMVRGSMACGPHHDSLIIRIGEEAAVAAMRQPHVRAMDFTGKVMKSFATIDAAGIRSEAQLRCWVEQAAAYAESLAKGKLPTASKAGRAPRKRSRT